MRKAKKLFSLFLAVTMFTGLFTARVSAATMTVSINNNYGVHNANHGKLTVTITNGTADSYEYRWTRWPKVNGSWPSSYTIPGATGDTFYVGENDIGNKIQVFVTPITGGVKGTEVSSGRMDVPGSQNMFEYSSYVSRSQTNIADYKENPSTYFVSIAGEDLIILDEFLDENSVYAITADFKGKHQYESNAEILTRTSGNKYVYFDPTRSDNIAGWLNGAFLTSNGLASAMQPYLISKTWWIGGGANSTFGPTNFTPYQVSNVKVGLLGTGEYAKYMSRIGWGPSISSGDYDSWWTRNANGAAGGYVQIVRMVADHYGSIDSHSGTNGEMYVRPTFYLNNDIFLEQKADVATMGSGVKEMLVRNYAREQLRSLYTEAELDTIGFENTAYIATTVVDGYDSHNTKIYTRNVSSKISRDSWEYQWYRSDSQYGTYTPMYLETHDYYIFTEQDLGKWLRCELTPIKSGVRGRPILSASYNVAVSYQNLGYTDGNYVARNQTNINDYKENPSEYFVSIAGEDLIVLNEYDDSVYVITDDFKGERMFDTNESLDRKKADFTPSRSTNIAYWLNNDYYNNNLSSAIKSYIPTSTWWVGGCLPTTYNPISQNYMPYSVSAKIGLISTGEYAKYKNRIGWAPHGVTNNWWTRSASGTAGGYVAMIETQTSGKYGNTAKDIQTPTHDVRPVRPTFYLDDDIFLAEKANVATMGSAIKEMLLRRYTDEQLLGIYTSAELAAIKGNVAVNSVSYSAGTLTFTSVGRSLANIFVATFDASGNLTYFDIADSDSESMNVGTGFSAGKIFIWGKTKNEALLKPKEF